MKIPQFHIEMNFGTTFLPVNVVVSVAVYKKSSQIGVGVNV